MQAQDYGGILYEISDAKHILDEQKGKVGAKAIAQRIYMILLGAALFGWFLYSLIAAAIGVGVGKAIVGHLAAFFVLTVIEVILMLTAFGAWGAFLRAAFRHNVRAGKTGREIREIDRLEEELAELDENKKKENAVRIYKEYVVVLNDGEETVLRRDSLQRVKCEPQYGSYRITFFSSDDTQVEARHLLPIADLPLIKRFFDCFEYVPASREKGYVKKKLPTIGFMFFPLLVGVALLIVRSLVLPDMPIIFGIVFVTLSVFFMIMQFNDLAIIGHGVEPILGGLIIMALPIGIVLTILDLTGMGFTEMMSEFTVVHAGIGLFIGLGAMLVILGIADIIICKKL